MGVFLLVCPWLDVYSFKDLSAACGGTVLLYAAHPPGNPSARSCVGCAPAGGGFTPHYCLALHRLLRQKAFCFDVKQCSYSEEHAEGSMGGCLCGCRSRASSSVKINSDSGGGQDSVTL